MVELQIVVTEKCNLGCSYCYMENKNTFMTGEAFDEFYESLPINDYSLSFFGGEPLLNWGMVEYITSTVKDDPRFKKLIIYSNGLTITPYMVDFMLENKIHFSWSCDVMDTEKSFNGAWGMLEEIKRLTNIVNITITPNNMDFVKYYECAVYEMGMIPSFTISNDGWENADLFIFESQYRRYINHIIGCFSLERTEIPPDIMRNFGILIDGTQGDKPKSRCFDVEDRKCLMPSGEVGFCARRTTEGDFSFEFDQRDYYDECNTCDINNFCDKQCWCIIDNQKGLNKAVCEINRIVLNETIRLNHELSRDVVWTNNVLRRFFNDQRRNTETGD